MSNYNIIAGLDIGTTKVCIVVAIKNKNDQLEIIGIGKVPSAGIKKGVIVNIDETVECIKKARKEAKILSGCDIDSVYAGIAGSHIECKENFGVYNVKGSYISAKDLKLANQAASSINVPADKIILHSIPREYVVDNERGIKDPRGMSGYRLETRVHIVMANNSSIQNISKCVSQSGLDLDGIVFEPLASSQAILSEDEKELGVALVDIGGGTSDLAVFYEGSIVYSASLSLGGEYFTKDISYCLKTPYLEAEKLKCQYGAAWTKLVSRSEFVDVPSVGGRMPRRIPRYNLVDIMQARLDFTSKKIYELLEKSAYLRKIASGIVFTGGSSLIPGIDNYCENMFNIPARVAKPEINHGLKTIVNNPIYSTPVGLIKYAMSNYLTYQKSDEKSLNSVAKKISKVYNELFSMF